MVWGCQIAKKMTSFPTRFFKNPLEGIGHVEKCIETKNWYHFEKPTFWDVKLCPLTQNYSFTLKAGISTLSFFSSDKKRCRHACNVSYQSWEKTKCSFPPSEWMNKFGLKGKVVHLKKLVFQSGVSFLFQCIFQHGHCPLVDFWRIWSGNFLFFWQFGILIPW